MKTKTISLLGLALLTASVFGQKLAPPAEGLFPPRGSIDPTLSTFDPNGEDIAPLAPTIADEQLLVDLYLKLNNYPAAGAAADKILAKHPRDPVALSAKTTIALHEQNVVDSLRWAAKYRSAQPGPSADLMLAGAYRLARRFDDAFEILEQLKKKTPEGEAFPHLIEFGYTYYDSRQFDRARAVFHLVRNDNRFPQKTRDDATKQIANLNRERTITSAYRAIELRDLDEARALAEDQKARDKKDKVTKPDPNLIALFAILDAEQHAYVDAALATFEELRAKTPSGKRFQFNSAYATQLLDKRRYPEALAALKLADPELNHYFTKDEIAQHREALHFIKKFTNPVIESAIRLQDFSEGRAVRSSIIASTPLNKALTRIGLDYTYNDLDLDVPTPGNPADTYHRAYLTARHQFSDRIHGSAAIGSVNGHFAYRAAVGWSRPSQDQYAELSFAGGHQPVDTLLLESIGAQEDRLALSFSTEIPDYRRFRLKGNAFLRQIDLTNSSLSDLGSGWGARIELEYLLYRENRESATIAAYLGAEKFDFATSNPNVALLGFDPRNLVEDEYQAIGIVLSGEKAYDENISFRGAIGMEYRIDSNEPVYSASGGIKRWINDDAFMHLDATYSSSGKASNEGGGYFEGIIGVDLTL